MVFRETLPNDCPPSDAHDGGCASAFRFVPADPAIAANFDSYAAQGKPLPVGTDVTPCRWASCSLYSDLATARKKRKLKSLKKYRFVAELRIPAKSGKMKEVSGHIDLWMYKDFDPIAAIVLIRDLDNG
jgi:hypothetical protein